MAFSSVQTVAATGPASSTTADYAFGSNVTSGNLAIICTAIFSTDSYNLTAGVCAQQSGTATIGTVALDKQINFLGFDGYYKAAIWSAPITGTGSLTMRLTVTASSYFLRGAMEMHSDVGTSFTVEGTNSNTTAVNVSNADTGNVTSAGAAAFVAALSLGASTAITEDAAFTLIVEDEGAGGGEVGNICRRFVTTGTTDSGSWTFSGSQSSGASCVLVVYKDSSSPSVTSGSPTYMMMGV